MIKKLLLLTALLCLGIVSVFFISPTFTAKESSNTDLASESPQVTVPVELPLEQRYPYVVPPKTSLSQVLRSLDISAQEIHSIVHAAMPHRNLARIVPGTRFQLFYSEADPSEFRGIKFRFTPQEIIHVQRVDGVWHAEKIIKPVTTKVVTFKGVVKSSLWESAAEAKMNPTLISELAEIFAWQVDFAREVQVNDRWRLSVEQEFIGSEAIGWGSILSAEYINSGVAYTAVLFRKGDEDLGYFAPDGSSLKKMFLKSPIQYGRISSKFQKRRFHPVLKTARPHLGVDYAAPTGTPIRAVGDGRVTMARWSGGGGNVIKIRHNSTYETAYKHLSRFAKGIKPGTKVVQGQTIGYVGSTGLSTGPHLHFEFFVAGRYTDPLSQKFPQAAAVPSIHLADFSASKASFLSQLPEWDFN